MAANRHLLETAETQTKEAGLKPQAFAQASSTAFAETPVFSTPSNPGIPHTPQQTPQPGAMPTPGASPIASLGPEPAPAPDNVEDELTEVLLVPKISFHHARIGTSLYNVHQLARAPLEY